jgi:hypothetical protein
MVFGDVTRASTLLLRHGQIVDPFRSAAGGDAGGGAFGGGLKDACAVDDGEGEGCGFGIGAFDAISFGPAMTGRGNSPDRFVTGATSFSD